MMSKQEFVKAMLYLGTSYGKEMPKGQIEIWYEHFMNISYDALIRAIKKIAITNKFMPSVAELIEACQNVELAYRNEIIEIMYQDGYFHQCVTGKQSDIEAMSDKLKAEGFLSQGIIPDWFEKDMIRYGYKPKMKLPTHEPRYSLPAGNYLEARY